MGEQRGKMNEPVVRCSPAAWLLQLLNGEHANNKSSAHLLTRSLTFVGYVIGVTNSLKSLNSGFFSPPVIIYNTASTGFCDRFTFLFVASILLN